MIKTLNKPVHDTKGLYDYSVIEVCKLLHEDFKGSTDTLQPEERHELIEWLTWRVFNWQETPYHKYRAAEDAILKLAVTVLHEIQSPGTVHNKFDVSGEI